MSDKVKTESEFLTHELFNNLIWMTTKEAATYLRLSPTALRIAVSRGEVLARKFRGKLYFKRRELDALIENSLKRSC